jgi:hypothetical protein
MNTVNVDFVTDCSGKCSGKFSGLVKNLFNFFQLNPAQKFLNKSRLKKSKRDHIDRLKKPFPSGC